MPKVYLLEDPKDKNFPYMYSTEEELFEGLRDQGLTKGKVMVVDFNPTHEVIVMRSLRKL